MVARTISLDRDLPNNSSTAAETFIYGLDQIMLFPPDIGHKKVRWTEVAP